ncbi:hypothetical protein [Marinibacterium sp. SX1]|uniref:hypothetical protein n=1 Tax=Marinibacterium sp. SX1 TaxID=3388424 RepID=UPI003D16DBAC
MNITQIKAAVDAGKSVHWANEGYRVHRDILGQYLITFVPNGSAIGLTDRSGHRLNGAEADFFIVVSTREANGEQEGRCEGRRRRAILTLGRADGQERKERRLWVFAIP